MTAVCEKLDRGRNALFSKVFKFRAKMNNGYYDFVNTTCFCGEDDSIEVMNKDRYGIDYSLHLCKNCGLMFAKSRMTHDSGKDFYDNEYRDIYDFGVDLDADYKNGQKVSKLIKNMMHENDIEYKTVFEIGCNTGGALYEFKDLEHYGVDYNENAISIADDNGFNVIHGGISELEKLDKKADLIILNHVMEHFDDIEYEMDRISKLLSEDGHMFISVPPFYGADMKYLFQGAHNWQFTVNTLSYVMECCGYSSIYINNEIDSIWQYTGVKREKEKTYIREARDIWGYAFSGEFYLPSLNTNCKFPLKDRKESVKKSLSYKFPDIRELKDKEKGREAIVISGAPSINEYIDNIKEMKEEGHVVISIDRMYSWCLNNGIVPDYVVAIDGSEDVVESFENINEDTVHIISSICREEVCDILVDKKTYIYSSQQTGIQFANDWDKNEYEKVTILNTGSTVSLASLVASTYLGARDVHVFGFDCHIMNGNYAKGISGKGAIPKEAITLNIEGKNWLTTMPFTAFAQQFFHIYVLLKSNDMLKSVKVYGDSLLKAMSKNINIDGG